MQRQNRKRQRTEEHKAAFEKGMVQGYKKGMQHLYQQRGATLVNELVVPGYLPSVQASSLKLALPKKMPAKLAMAKKTEPVEPAPEKVATNHMSDPVKVKLAHTLPAQEATEDPSTLNGEYPIWLPVKPEYSKPVSLLQEDHPASVEPPTNEGGPPE